LARKRTDEGGAAVKKIDCVLIRVVARKYDEEEGYYARDSTLYFTSPERLETVEDQCQRVFKKTFDLVCEDLRQNKEAQT
jgi:hypothetical protein